MYKLFYPQPNKYEINSHICLENLKRTNLEIGNERKDATLALPIDFSFLHGAELCMHVAVVVTFDLDEHLAEGHAEEGTGVLCGHDVLAESHQSVHAVAVDTHRHCDTPENCSLK